MANIKAGKTTTVSTGSEFDFSRRLLSGRTIKITVHPIKGGFQIARAGRRGGVRSIDKARGGMLVCTPTRFEPGDVKGSTAYTHCLRAKDVLIFPGGGAKTRGWLSKVHLHGYQRRRKRR